MSHTTSTPGSLYQVWVAGRILRLTQPVASPSSSTCRARDARDPALSLSLSLSSRTQVWTLRVDHLHRYTQPPVVSRLGAHSEPDYIIWKLQRDGSGTDHPRSPTFNPRSIKRDAEPPDLLYGEELLPSITRRSGSHTHARALATTTGRNPEVHCERINDQCLTRLPFAALGDRHGPCSDTCAVSRTGVRHRAVRERERERERADRQRCEFL